MLFGAEITTLRRHVPRTVLVDIASTFAVASDDGADHPRTVVTCGAVMLGVLRDLSSLPPFDSSQISNTVAEACLILLRSFTSVRISFCSYPKRR
ncbi:hypothetical protein AURDEDRAFT_177716 [Auricularia subglabra TFB-10046 SS5]|uniref:Uncharacterized protein n=1 Tax=Auricularia subglabra (strain TFB-10046 / SS5) TaxID=717982 RepID=J0CSE8_AURST|nr:hypothetical protein AURDEDRAFT_177716 [Auricularia subglabra TFB-10046 SS5]